MRATFLVRLLAGAVTARLMPVTTGKMVNDYHPGPRLHQDVCRPHANKMQDSRKKEEDTGRRQTDERKRTTTDDGETKYGDHEIPGAAPLAPDPFPPCLPQLSLPPGLFSKYFFCLFLLLAYPHRPFMHFAF